MKPGDIGWMPYENHDGTGDPYRPLLIVDFGPTGPNEDQVVILAPMTANEERVNNPRNGDLVIPDPEACRLRWPTIIRCRQVVCVPRTAIVFVNGAVDLPTLFNARQLIREILESVGEPTLFP